jgi:hypothetical protein
VIVLDGRDALRRDDAALRGDRKPGGEEAIYASHRVRRMDGRVTGLQRLLVEAELERLRGIVAESPELRSSH